MDYQDQSNHNKKQFMEMMKQIMPELHILAVMLEDSKVNPTPLFYVARHMAEIANGTGYGQVHILIEGKEVKFVRGEHASKVNELVLVDRQ